MSPDTLSTISYVIAALTAGGGTMGYVKTGSIPSIAAGWTVGVLCMDPKHASPKCIFRDC